MDKSAKIDLTDNNTVIYGHNIKSGKMFAELEKIYKQELGEEVTIEIMTKEENSIYKVFSVCKMDLDNTTIKKNFTEKEKKNYIDKFIKKSVYEFDIDINYENSIITLVTCDSTGNQRIVVHAIKC